MMIVNDDSRVVNKLEVSLTDDARVVFYDCHMFIVHATVLLLKNISQNSHSLQLFAKIIKTESFYESNYNAKL
jgi:hypothetical protein